MLYVFFFFFSSRRRHTRSLCDWSSDVCSSDLRAVPPDEGGEGRFVVTFEEAAEQFAVAQPRTFAQHGPAKVFDHAARRAGRHVPPSAGVPARPLPLICRTMMI